MSNDSLCWDCKNSVCSGCCWAKDFQPVPGWRAEKVYKDSQTYGSTFKVTSCPKFIPDDYFFLKELVKARYGISDHTFFNYLKNNLIDSDGYYKRKRKNY